MLAFYYFLFILTGWFLAFLYGRHTKGFLWREYGAILVFPLLGIIGLVKITGGIAPLTVFIVSAIIGPGLEWLFGLFYHKVMGSRLWLYERYPLPGRYTSWLTLPVWGFGLLLFWLILKNF